MVSTEIAQEKQGKHPPERPTRPYGYVVTATSRVAQRALGVDRPVFEELTAADFRPEHQPIDVRFTAPVVQTGLAFVLDRPLAGPNVTMVDVVRAVDHVLLAAEVGESQESEASRRVVVLGTRPSSVDGIDLRLAGCLLHRDGELVETGAGGMMLGSPLNALVWLANEAFADGLTLAAGQVVLVCSMTRSATLPAGAAAVVSVPGLGSVTAVLGA
ncbi:2-keto-4-pentenoate hydratase [Saccharothrix ecbatanensis]|uniref:2-keto-4-pentenoate hydratase n=1 Tax=Saccharothrix ecbatanensis TaxID=1105145 RepID=A0A7W9HGA9_9PSEU|nr:2-keto-4-pentenoate hydratase [Saccharothrix ecbatanensis]MBB5801459.1 2-keto-4-pentenoate hydratase [Saccharothrix ecbatanensis]